MKSIIGCRISPVSIAITWDDGTPSIIASDHPKFKEIGDKLNAKDYEGLSDLINPAEAIKEFLGGRVQVTNNSIKLDGEPIENPVVPVILNMIEKDEDPNLLLAFLTRLVLNPSFNSRRQLWNFIEQNGITLYAGPRVKVTKVLSDKGVVTETDFDVDATGWLVLYKGVKPDLTDEHTGKLLNEPGTQLIMDRAKVDDNPDAGCSNGYHAGAYSYVQSFGTRKLVVLVDPADVVSVPHDSSCAKVRDHRYIVLKEVEGEQFRDLRDNLSYGDDDPEDVEQEGDICEGKTYRVEGWDEHLAWVTETVEAESAAEAAELSGIDDVESVELL